MEEKKSIKSRLIEKVIIRIATIFAVFAVLLTGAYFGWKKFIKISVEKKHALVERSLEEVSELIVYKIKYSDIVSIKKKAGFLKAYSIVRYSGIIRAGIEDISKIQFTVSEDAMGVEVKLPHCVILGNEISELSVFDEKQSVFFQIAAQELFDEIKAAKLDAESDFVSEGFLNEADERALFAVKKIISALGFKRIYVSFM